MKRIRRAIKWQNDMVMVFDEHGRQVPELQGKYQDVRDKVLAAADSFTSFEHGVWRSGWVDVVRRGQW